MEEWRYTPRILNLRTRYRCVMCFDPRSLYFQGKRRRTDWKGVWVCLGAPSGRCGGVKNLFPLSGIEPDAYLVIPVCHPLILNLMEVRLPVWDTKRSGEKDVRVFLPNMRNNPQKKRKVIKTDGFRFGVMSP
jgi:hypothetical protein